jgi:hypothetical protein
MAGVMRILATLSGFAFFLALGALAVRTTAQGALASKGGVLEVTRTVYQGVAHRDAGAQARPLAGT